MKILLYFTLTMILGLAILYGYKDFKGFVSYEECNSAIVYYKNEVKGEVAEIGYEAGCRNGSSSSCEFVKDNRKRHQECLNSAIINCKTWALQFKEEIIKTKKEKKK